MSGFRLHAPSPALVVSIVALLVALGGTGYAAFALPKNSVGTKQLKKNAVTTKKLKNGAVTAPKINTNGLTVPYALHANSAPPTGGAGGALSGSYPNPGLAAGAVGTSNFGTIPSADLREVATGTGLLTSGGDTQVCFGSVGSDTDGLAVAGGGSNGCAAGQFAGLKAPVTGEYLLTAGADFEGSSSTGERRININEPGGASPVASTEISPNAVGFTSTSAATVLHLAAGQVIELNAFQSSASGTVALDGADPRVYLTMSWIAPS